MRIILAIILFAHGIAHLPGFIVSFQLTALEEIPYKTTILAGNVDLGDVGIKVMGALWLTAALAFSVSGISTIARVQSWKTVTLLTSVFSLFLCITGRPDARFGLFINLALIAFLLANRRINWLKKI